MSAPRVVLVRSGDTAVRRALERVAAEAGLRLSEGAPAADAPPPDAVVVDLDAPDPLSAVRAVRRSYPDAFVAGHSAVPSRQLWLDAEEAGCDLVVNRGALANRLVQKLPPPGRPRRRRVVVAESADLPGRIGVVARRADTPLGPVALYQLRGELHALADLCPHAGATVSTGELEGSVITCPGHGSQFDVCSGERVRGPADCALRTFEVVEEDGLVYLLC